jgi:hypothetical protein
MKLTRILVPLLVLATILLAGCGTTERDWKVAKDVNTAPGYADFLAKHPQGSHVDEARAAIDEIDWTSIKTKNTSAGYNKYLLTYPAGRHTSEAKAAIEAIDAVTYIPLNMPCGARVAEMGFTFFGTPSGKLASFDCQDKAGKTIKITLKSKDFIDGKIETEDFGIIVMKRTNGTAAAYEILASQMKKLEALLRANGNAAQSSEPPGAPAKN